MKLFDVSLVLRCHELKNCLIQKLWYNQKSAFSCLLTMRSHFYICVSQLFAWISILLQRVAIQKFSEALSIEIIKPYKDILPHTFQLLYEQCDYYSVIFADLRACFKNSSNSSSRSLFFGMLPTKSRWLLKDMVTPILFPFRSSQSFSWNHGSIR